MFLNFITLIFLVVILFLIKKLGFGNYGKKFVVENYLGVVLDGENRIFIKIKKKNFYFFEREKNYEIKYIRGKNNFEEIKEYFDVTLKNQDFIIKEINSNKFFDFQKKAIVLLRNPISVLNKIPHASKRDKFDNDVIKFDERLNVLYFALKGEMLKFIPAKNGDKLTWLSVNEAFGSNEIPNEFKNVLSGYIGNLNLCMQDGECKEADKSLEQISSFQRGVLGSLAPSEAKVGLEVLYNQMEIFKFLIYFYMILGLVSLALVGYFLERNLDLKAH